jgi:hypothetical protein
MITLMIDKATLVAFGATNDYLAETFEGNPISVEG